MKIVQTNNVRLPYRLAKGSAFERSCRAEKCNKQIFNTIKYKAEGNSVKLDTIREALFSKLYCTITCILSKEISEGSNIAGGTSLLKSKITNELSGYEIFLPLQKDETVHVQDLHVVMHEFRHLLDMINNPKINQRKIACSEFSESDFKMNYMDSIYNSKIYTRKKYDKYAILDALEILLLPFSSEERINVLQLLRYRLKLEYDAYKESSNIQRELKRIYGEGFNKTDYIPVGQFNFPRKIKLLEDRLKQEIFEMRKSGNSKE